MRKRGCERLRQAPVLWQKDARMGTRRRRTHHLHDGSFGIAQGCRPGNEGKTPLGTAHLMQKRALIAMQYSALHSRTWITPTVQKPCRNRAETVHPWLTKQKSHEIFRFTVSTLDIPTGWDPRAKQSRPVRVPSIVQTKKKNQNTFVFWFFLVRWKGLEPPAY